MKKFVFFRQKKEVKLLKCFYIYFTYIHCSVISIMACIAIPNSCQFRVLNCQLKQNIVSLNEKYPCHC